MKQPLLTTTALISLSFLAICVSNPAHANPEGGKVVGGSATISENGKKLDIHQHSDRAVIDWQNFNIEVDEHTEFHQPSSSATALNRVNSADPSRIAGKLSANGNIILVNPNGVFFEGSSRIDVNGIVATTANIRPEDFMAGSNEFNIPGNPDAAIINKGIITAKDAGLVGLVAPHVENHGIIQAKMGRVQLASGDTVTVDFYGDGLLKVAVTDENVKSQIVGNSGVLSADGGTVAMTAAAAKETVNSLIVAEGLIEAKTIGRDANGAIIIGGEGSNKTEKSGDAYVAVSGYMDASGRNEGEQGGTIEVLGDHIAITETAFLDASGFEAPIPNRKPESGTATMSADKPINNAVRTESDFLSQGSRAGGSIKIGGDYLGTGDTQTAKTVKVAEGALIRNNALDEGDAGRTIIWSDDTTEFSGLVLATGGAKGGHGGFLETSGKINLVANGYADLSAKDGFSKGTYLLDPTNITIYGNFDPNTPTMETELWLDGADTSTLDCGTGFGNCTNTDLLQNWNDKSGNVGNDATVTGGEEPEFRTSAINGQSSIYFDGSLNRPLGGSLNRTSSSSSFFAVYFQESAGGNDRALFEAAGGGDRYFLLDRRFASNSNYTTLFDQTTILNADAFGTGTAAVYRDGATVNAAYSTMGSFDGGNVLDNYVIGDDVTGGNRFRGWISEVLMYDGALSENDRNLVEQYQSAKWNIALTPPGTGADELAQATASDGYSVFSTRYLERLSNGADIVLAATNSITFDLQGDTLSAGNNQSISLTTTNLDIQSASAGTVQTSGTGGITFNAGQDILFAHDLDLTSTGSGNISLTAARDINVGTTADISTSTGTIDFTAGRDVLLGADVITASTTVDAIQIDVADDFINSAGSNALQATNSNWIVYSNDPVGNQNNGLLPNESFYNQANIAATIASKTLAGNNVFGYTTATRPTITYDVDNNNVEYGEAIAGNSVTYNSGLVGDDTLGMIGQSGSATFGGYTPGDNVNTYVGGLTGATGTLANVLGYDYTFNAGDLTVTPATLTVTANNQSRAYGDNASTTDVSYSGFKLTDTLSVLETAAMVSSAVGNTADVNTYINDLTASGAVDAEGNYVFSYNAGDLTVTQADLDISVDPTFETINQGEPLPSYNLSYVPFKLADTFADLDVLPTITMPSNNLVGSFPVTLSGGLDNNYNYIFTNGTLEILAFVATNNDVTIPSTVEQDLNTRILGNRSNNQELNIPALEARSLPDSQIDIEIEGVSDELPELNPTEEKKRKIKLKIDKDLANQLNLQINDGVL